MCWVAGLQPSCAQPWKQHWRRQVLLPVCMYVWRCLPAPGLCPMLPITGQLGADVVWEHLMDVSNDTQLVDGQFRPFVPHASHEQARERQAAALDSQWAAAAATGECGIGHKGAGRCKLYECLRMQCWC